MNKLITLASMLMAALAVPAHAQFAKPEDAVKYRKASLTVLGTHFGRLGAMASGRVPYDAKAAADNADVIARQFRAVTFFEVDDEGEPDFDSVNIGGKSKPTGISNYDTLFDDDAAEDTYAN